MNDEQQPQQQSDRRVISGTLFRERRQAVSFTTKPPSPPRPPARRPAHVAKMLALAHHLVAAIEQGAVADQAAVARKLGLTRARITQLLDLTLLAPDVQAQILVLEAVDGREPLKERALRGVLAAGLWPQQRAAWGRLQAAAREPRKRTGRRTLGVPRPAPAEPATHEAAGPNGAVTVT
jgi:hypothetical protein